MEDILIATTDRSIVVFIPDPASTDGSGKTGLTHAELTVSYTRVETDNEVTVSDVTSSLSTLSALTDAHTDWGVKEVSSTLAPGLYRLDVADAVFASGAWYAVVYVQITSSAASATPKAFRLVGYNALDGVRLGLTALPNAAADAAGGLPISDAGGLDLDSKLANTNEVTAARMGALTDWINGGRLDLILDIIAQDTTTDIPGLIAALNNLSSAQVTAAVPTATQNATAVWTVGNMATAAMKRIADFVLRRNTANAATSTETGLDTVSFRSPIGAIRKLTNKVDTTTNSGKLTVFEEDDTTQAATQTLATDAAAEPITGANTD